MDKSGKTYVKAMNKYNDGYIDKALALCEKSISLNITNAAALNLKGILYYLKGDLENAKKMWNINYKRNNDKISKKYIKDSIRDKEKLQLYVSSLELIKSFNISGALEILEQCEDSDFNFINVNNLISLCYIKQGEYDKALPHIVKVLKTDKKNTAAIMNKKTLIEYGNLKREINYKKTFIVAAGIFVAISLILISKTYMYKLKNISTTGIKKVEKNTELVEQSTNMSTEKPVEKKPAENKAIENKTTDLPKFPKEQLTESIKNNNMEQIVGYLNQWNKVDLDMNDKLLMVKGEEIIKNNGIVYFYEKGIKYMEDKNFMEAEKYFLYALPYSKDNYLSEHIIYMLAVSYKSSSDFEKAIKYYENCLKQFPKGSYTEEALYNLILINKDVDKNKAVGYAEKLVDQFPNSQYYNTIVKNILK
ncbi:tetratricopeptide repeat protein [Clostridium bowmanii]|uniref:tetratricopeptide repeat protein n=1 Tax=Clostridium bowmanii TaxID=132925 RepID=UPI001C0B0B69|nr:tetratricopeptide repeat protein [Clostridium bowmanii]MBU3188549.1 tetratricopeptide repeat protein [Clostridium bowmanii]MCA1072933.1 tetratricopeptide repeat protein [Clostridium bowmanii]